MPLYFAYGSNMSPRQMQRRCPGARAVGAAVLQNWSFLIPGGRGANVRPMRGGVVHGVVWRVTGPHVAALDQWEGTRAGAYRRVLLPIELDDRRTFAITYVSDRTWPGREPGRGRANYILTAVLPGAAAFALPQPYREEIRAWLGRRPIGPTKQVYVGRRSRKRCRIRAV
ncbi:MAG: gamma-glutamylcyclotransferase family protein [Pseudomonadota bacterium]